MGENTKSRSRRSQPVTSAPACRLCQSNPEQPPCDRCPLYGAWLERRGHGDHAGWRFAYAIWVQAGGWTAVWAAGRARERAERTHTIRTVLELYPRVRERWPNYPSMVGGRW